MSDTKDKKTPKAMHPPSKLGEAEIILVRCPQCHSIVGKIHTGDFLCLNCGWKYCST